MLKCVPSHGVVAVCYQNPHLNGPISANLGLLLYGTAGTRGVTSPISSTVFSCSKYNLLTFSVVIPQSGSPHQSLRQVCNLNFFLSIKLITEVMSLKLIMSIISGSGLILIKISSSFVLVPVPYFPTRIFFEPEVLIFLLMD